MSTNVQGQVSAQIDTKQMLGAVKFSVDSLYYNYSPIDIPAEFVGKYIGVNADGCHVFENSKGEQRDVVYGVFFEPATEAQINEFF